MGAEGFIFAVQRVRVSLVALIAAAVLCGVAGDALAATSVSGRVTSATTTLGLPNTVVNIFDLDADRVVLTATTDGTGSYTANLPAGTYAALTQDTHGYINQIYSDLPCSANCDINSLTPIDVTSSAITNIDFVLDPGGRIAGTVTDSATGLPIANVRVNFYDGAGQLVFTSGVTDASGHYISDAGTATGNVFAVTANDQGTEMRFSTTNLLSELQSRVDERDSNCGDPRQHDKWHRLRPRRRRAYRRPCHRREQRTGCEYHNLYRQLDGKHCRFGGHGRVGQLLERRTANGHLLCRHNQLVGLDRQALRQHSLPRRLLQPDVGHGESRSRRPTRRATSTSCCRLAGPLPGQ